MLLMHCSSSKCRIGTGIIKVAGSGLFGISDERIH
jgi:hypothetical protein